MEDFNTVSVVLYINGPSVCWPQMSCLNVFYEAEKRLLKVNTFKFAPAVLAYVQIIWTQL